MAASGKKKKTTKTSPGQVIEVRGARQNNLKGIDLDIPVGKLKKRKRGQKSLVFFRFFQ